ncbi:MAG: hypothetical protein DMG49_01005 [Acidobacteria bacterium]|nr:MAG: hypothetical protein DMG49_01005 [Acidobacteriota bacterium]
MNSPLKLGVPDRLFPALQEFSVATARTGNFACHQKMLCGLLAVTWPFAAAFAQSSSSSQQSSSQQSSTEAQPQSPAQPATPGQHPQKEDSLAEAARKAKAKKPAAANGKVYTEDDLSRMKGPGVSVVGEAPKKRARPTEPNGDGAENKEEYWRGRAQEILGQIAAVDEAMARMKDDIKKYGSGGFDVTTGMKDNIAYINDRNGQLKDLEKRKADLQKQLDELQDEGRKAGAPASWFR